VHTRVNGTPSTRSTGKLEFPARIVSFSGIDGAGKSTQIDLLLHHLQQAGISHKLYTFWDDIACLKSVRERASHRVFKGDRGVGSPSNPIRRRDKNVKSWYATALRFVLYTLDAVKVRTFLKGLKGRALIVIFDRYLYDELANLPLQHEFARVYVRGILRLIPKPDVAILLDADPESASSRKPEYPAEFVRENRDAYIALSRLAQMIVIPPAAIENTASAIRKLVCPPDVQQGALSQSTCTEVHSFQRNASASNT
jgi:thymidylate kinase